MYFSILTFKVFTTYKYRQSGLKFLYSFDKKLLNCISFNIIILLTINEDNEGKPSLITSGKLIPVIFTSSTHDKLKFWELNWVTLQRI